MDSRTKWTKSDLRSGYEQMEREAEKAIRDNELLKQIQLKNAEEFPGLIAALRETADVLNYEVAAFKEQNILLASSQIVNMEQLCTRKECVDAKKKCNELENEKEEVTRDLRTLGNLAASLKIDLSDAKRELNDSKRYIKELTEKKDQLEVEIHELQLEAEQYKQESAALTDEKVTLMTKLTNAVDKMGKKVEIKIGDNVVVGAGGSEGEYQEGGFVSSRPMDVHIGANAAVAVDIAEGGALAVGEGAQAGSVLVQTQPADEHGQAGSMEDQVQQNLEVSAETSLMPYNTEAVAPLALLTAHKEYVVYTLCHCKEKNCDHNVAWICLCGERFYSVDGVIKHQQRANTHVCCKGIYYEMANTVVKTLRRELPTAPTPDELTTGAAAFLSQLQNHLTTQELNIDYSSKLLDTQRIKIHLLSQEIYRFVSKKKSRCTVM